LRDRWFGAYRWLWNTALEIRTEAYRECGLTPTGNDISRWLTQWKRTAGHEWLKLVPATGLTQCLSDQDAAFRKYTETTKDGAIEKRTRELPLDGTLVTFSN
jgi:hypothetical protein